MCKFLDHKVLPYIAEYSTLFYITREKILSNLLNLILYMIIFYIYMLYDSYMYVCSIYDLTLDKVYLIDINRNTSMYVNDYQSRYI